MASRNSIVHMESLEQQLLDSNDRVSKLKQTLTNITAACDEQRELNKDMKSKLRSIDQEYWVLPKPVSADHGWGTICSRSRSHTFVFVFLLILHHFGDICVVTNRKKI